MKKVIKKILYGIVLLSFSHVSVAKAVTIGDLTFRDIVEMALKNNSKVHQYQEHLLSKKYDQAGALSAYAPLLVSSGVIQQAKEPLAFNLDPIRDAMISLEARDQVQFASAQAQTKGGAAIASGSSQYDAYYNSYKNALDLNVPHFIDTLKEQQYPSASILMVQPVFTGLRITASNRAARAEMSAASFELNRIKNDVIKETIISSINCLLVKELIGIRKDVLTDIEQHLQKAQVLSDQGMIARYHLLRAKVAVSEAQRNLFDEQNRYELVQLSLKESCRIPDSVSIVIKDKMKYVNIPDSVDFFWLMAKKNQPVFSIINQNKSMAAQKVLASKGSLYPQVSLYGKYELFPDYLSAMEPAWIIGVQANLTLFSGGKNINSVRSAIHLTKEIAQIDSSAHRDVELWINKAYRDMRSAQTRYERLDADLDLASENLHQCQSRFENGYGTSLEVIDAELVIERNRVDRLSALGDYYKALTELYTAAGAPSEAINFIIGEGK